MELCQFRGCANPQASQQPKIGLRLCDEHTQEFAELVKVSDTKGIVGFWVRSGGLNRLEEDILTDLGYGRSLHS